ncbi:MAG: hypothetical protein M4579_000008 [Chaenotheca gracillima]|nr:MAG: hypothetical protein M4579_000008 [Chaenotheca gracillima]
MAPIPFLSSYSFNDAADLGLEQFSYDDNTQPYTRQLHAYLRSLGLEEVDATVGEYFKPGNLKRSLENIFSGSSNSPLSPRDVSDQLRARDPAPPSDPNSKGSGTINPMAISNKGMLILFGLLFGGLMIATIWFFFWARNGGFVFREGDWAEYKSTVLRKRDKNGKTLSNATKSTDLGGDSIVGEYDQDDMVQDRLGRDNDVRAYRHEKPARVGGLNRKADGSHWDASNTDRSEIMTEKPAPANKKKNKLFDRKKKEEPKKNKASNNKANNKRQPSAAYSFTQGDDMSTVAEHDYVEERPHRQHRATPPSNRYSHAQRASPSPRRARDQETVYSETATTYSGGYTDDGHTGTKSYHHPIPGLSKGARTNATFDTEPPRKARAGKGGYRRGGGQRRDSLSESD